MEIKVKTIEYDEAFLRQISVPVEFEKRIDLEKDIQVLDEFCKANEVMAMAAVQLGIPKRLVYLKNTNLNILNKIQLNSMNNEEKDYNEARVLINPIIVNREGLTEYWESCASCLDNFGLVLRPYKIDLEYYDIYGNKHLETFEGFESTVLSHEMDHLDGILHIDIAEKLLYMPSEERKVWRRTHGYKIYSKIGDYDLLKQKEKGKNKSMTKHNK